MPGKRHFIVVRSQGKHDATHIYDAKTPSKAALKAAKRMFTGKKTSVRLTVQEIFKQRNQDPLPGKEFSYVITKTKLDAPASPRMDKNGKPIIFEFSYTVKSLK